MTRILVDLDGTIADLHTPWLAWHERVCGCKVDVTKEDWRGASECGDRLFDFLDELGMYDEVEPVFGALDALKSLVRVNEVVVVSEAARIHLGRHYREKRAWLNQYAETRELPLIVVPSGYKKLVSGDFLIDDRPSVLWSWWMEQGGLGTGGYLIAQPWNEGNVDFDRGSWADFLDHITEEGELA